LKRKVNSRNVFIGVFGESHVVLFIDVFGEDQLCYKIHLKVFEFIDSLLSPGFASLNMIFFFLFVLNLSFTYLLKVCLAVWLRLLFK